MNISRLAQVLVVPMLLITATTASAQCDPAWDTTVGNLGLNSTVWSVYATNETSAVGPALYVGGQFTTAGGSAARSIARWDGTSWSPLGTGAENGGVVYAMAVSSNGVLYAGGAFGNMAGLAGTAKIAEWNGSNWSDVGGGLPSSNAGIRALAFFQGDLYAGGYQTVIGGVSANKIARWDGVNWSALPSDPLSTTHIVRALHVYADGNGKALYIGGYFENAGGDANADYIFRFDGTNYEPLGRGANNDVYAIAEFNGDLYIGGEFTRVYQSDGTELVANKIARWDGSSWKAVGAGMNTGTGYYVYALEVFDDGNGEALYAGGSFSTPANRIARWDGGSWSDVGVGSGPSGYVYDLAVFSHTNGAGLFAGGTFSLVNGDNAQRIAEWRSPAPAPPTDVEALPTAICASDNSDLSASAGSANIDWYTGGCGDTFIGTGGVLTVSPTATTTYYARSRNVSGCESATCTEVTVTVGEGPQISLQPSGATICAGDMHQLCVDANGVGTIGFQWQRDSVDIDGATSACYDATTSGEYQCVVTDDCSFAVSDPATVTIDPGVIITAQPEGGTICPSVNLINMCVSVAGPRALHYQWRRNGLTLIGATDDCYYTTTPGSFTVVVTGDCGPVESDPAVVVAADPATGDLNGDAVTDVADYAILAGCLDGPSAFLSSECQCMDANDDFRIDLADFAVFTRAFDVP